MARFAVLQAPQARTPASLNGSDATLAIIDTLGDIWRFIVETIHNGWTLLVEAEDLVLIRAVTSILILLAAVTLSRLVRRSLEGSAKRTAARNELDDWQTRALVSRSRPIAMVGGIILYIAAIILIVGVWQLQTAFLSLLTAAGFAGIVIGIAAANSMSNLISGFMIFYNHPFDIGDWVQIEDMEGIVVDVKPGATVIESWDGEKITYPNRIVEGSRIRNKSHQRKLRWRFPIGVDYATDIGKAREILLKIIKSHPDVLKDPEPQVIATEFGDSAIILDVRYWIAPLRARVLVIQTWLMQEIQRAFAKEGIVIPFPQRTVVWRFPEGNPPPGDTVSELAYDPDKDDQPWPGPPIDQPLDTTSAYAKQESSPLEWIEKVWDKKRRLLWLREQQKREQEKADAGKKPEGAEKRPDSSGQEGTGEAGP